ncbi:hypothetical protein BGW38_002262 [Lunasporangiospora selenospora]|uniref:Uncharacterized protein n=1 Tax=Lunasporangiospora selenospora TaxID=979761 RepID=A0A9P6FT32_9FUNG|nr:hypothetical protein BGW38_002262 [Lunasporangiospora selenospora]
MISTRLIGTLAMAVGLFLTWLTPSARNSRLEAMAPVLLGFLLGFFAAESPFAGPLQELLGLRSKHPDIVGLEIVHGHGKNAAADAADADEAKSKFDQRPMYGLQHAFLNLEVTGWWFNMGLWEKDENSDAESTNFKPMLLREACQALVQKVTQGLGIGQDSHILDVGFGCGDQDVYLAKLHKPGRITGITIEPIQHHVAQQLLRQMPTPGTEIDLHVADASKLPQFLQKNSSIFKRQQSTTEETDGETSSEQAPTAFAQKTVYEMVMSAMEIPITNMKTLEEYRQDFEEAGFVDIEIECVEDRVFSGLASFIDRQNSRLGGMVRPGVNWTYWFLSKALWWMHRSGQLHVVVVKARNGSH